MCHKASRHFHDKEQYVKCQNDFKNLLVVGSNLLDHFCLGFATRAISRSDATGFGNVQVLSEETTVSEIWLEKGRASASANKGETSMDNFAARSRATFSISRLTSMPIIRQPRG